MSYSKLFSVFVLYTATCIPCMYAQIAGSATDEVCLVGAKDLADASAPSFQDYSVVEAAKELSAPLVLSSNPIAREFRTVIRAQMKRGPNFAGHYRVAFWGCGTSCIQFALVNLNTGRVITARNIVSVSGDAFSSDADEFLSTTASDTWGLRYKRDSKLLVLVGAINEVSSNVGAFYFALQNEKLVLVHTTPVHTRSSCTR